MPFVMTYSLYNAGGTPHHLQVSTDSAEALIKELADVARLLEERGYSETMPDPSLIPRTERIVGYVISEANLKGGGTQPCVYLYNDNQQLIYKVITVYEERLDELPLGDLTTLKQYEGQPGAAPLRKNAEQKKLMHPCDFTVKLAPVKDRKTGKALTKVLDNGNEIVLYKFVRVVRVHAFPQRKFVNTTDAIQWGLNTRLFGSEDAVKGAYEGIKVRMKPTSSDEMWRVWIDYINSQLDDE